MASVDKDIDVKKVILSDEQFDSSSDKNKIPDAGDQSSNFAEEELFKQNIQMGEAGLSVSDEGLQPSGPEGSDRLNFSSKSGITKESQDDSTHSIQAESSFGSNATRSNSSSKSNSSGNASNEANSVLFSDIQGTQQESTFSDANSSQAASLNVNENSNNQGISNTSGLGSNKNTQVDSDASTPILNVENAEGDEDSAISLDISAALTDTDGSENLIIEINDIPEGAILSDGVNSFSANASSSSVNISEWSFDTLTVTPANDSESNFNLSINATSTEQSNSDTSTTTAALNVVVNSVNDSPEGIELDGSSVTENSDGAVVGVISTDDIDVSDTHSYTVSDSRFEIVSDSKGNVQLKLKDGQSFNYEKESSIEISVTSTDEGGLSVSQEFTINVNDVNDFNLITGTENADLLKGTSDDDKIVALDGNDRVYGGDGHDAIYGGEGNDVLTGQGGNDEVYGGAGNDSIYGGDGENVLDGGDGADRIYAHKGGTDEISGGAGNDYIYIDGNDKVDGGDGTDRVYTYGEEDISLNRGNANVEVVSAYTEANHNIDASTAEQGVSISMRGGDDNVQGSEHNDSISGGAGNDVIDGGAGSDRLYGESGDDIFVVGEGNDIVYGGDGSDLFILDALDGNDVFHGGTGEGWSDILEIDVAPSDTGDSDNPWSIEVNGENVEFSLADGGIDVGADVSGVISFADGTEVAFDGVEQIQW